MFDHMTDFDANNPRSCYEALGRAIYQHKLPGGHPVLKYWEWRLWRCLNGLPVLVKCAYARLTCTGIGVASCKS